jgi:hypothetical protein
MIQSPCKNNILNFLRINKGLSLSIIPYFYPMKRHWSIFWSPGFTVGLILLLFNDHYLKSTFHNFFTGKLSDVAGLFIFPIFFAVLLPKFKKHIYWITAIGFIFWKSPFSGSLIEIWNSLGLFTIKRVIDYSDLIALFILPVSYRYFEKNKSNEVRFTPIPVMIVAAFAFIATSKGPERIKVNYQHTFNFPLDTLKSRLFFNDQIKILDHYEYREKWQNLNSLEQNSIDSIAVQYAKDKDELILNTIQDTFWLFLPDTFCNNRGFQMRAIISGKADQSNIFIGDVTHDCHERKEDAKKRLAEILEEKLIKSLNK